MIATSPITRNLSLEAPVTTQDHCLTHSPATATIESLWEQFLTQVNGSIWTFTTTLTRCHCRPLTANQKLQQEVWVLNALAQQRIGSALAAICPLRGTRVSSLPDPCWDLSLFKQLPPNARYILALLFTQEPFNEGEETQRFSNLTEEEKWATTCLLASLLFEGSPRVRLRALTFLKLVDPLEHPQIAENLLLILRQERSPQLVRLAAELLERMPSHHEPLADQLLPLLEQSPLPHPLLVYSLSKTVRRVGDKVSTPLLHFLLRVKEEYMVSQEAIDAFCREDVSYLLEAVTPGHPSRSQALTLICQMGTSLHTHGERDQFITALQSALEDPDLQIQRRAFTALVSLGEPIDAGTATKVADWLKDARMEPEKLHSLNTLGRKISSTLRPLFTAVLKQELAQAETDAQYLHLVKALLAIHAELSSAEVTLLLSMLHSEDAAVRSSTLDLLENVKVDPSVLLPALKTALKDTDPYVTVKSAALLSRFGGLLEEAGQIFQDRLETKSEPRCRKVALQALAQLDFLIQPERLASLLSSLERVDRHNPFLKPLYYRVAHEDLSWMQRWATECIASPSLRKSQVKLRLLFTTLVNIFSSEPPQEKIQEIAAFCQAAKGGYLLSLLVSGALLECGPEVQANISTRFAQVRQQGGVHSNAS